MTDTSLRRWRKKPVVIEAVKFNGSSSQARAIHQWILGNEYVEPAVQTRDLVNLTIETLEGEMLANPGDYIIRGVQGEFYPCKSDIFEATYERVADDERTNPVSEVRGGEAP